MFEKLQWNIPLPSKRKDSESVLPEINHPMMSLLVVSGNTLYE